MRRPLVLLLTFLVVFVLACATGPNCKKGKPCGNTCIAKSKTCHK